MRRPRIVDILLIGLLGCGLALSVCGDTLGAAVQWTGTAMIAVAGVWACSAFLKLRRRYQNIADVIAKAGNAQNLEPQAIADVAPDCLGTAIGDALAAARRAAVDAELRAKELELRLKISNVEREHAEEIISGMSDAVVVTDPCEEVVLANESAARAFKFDLESAAHTPVRNLVRDPKLIELIRQVRQAGGKIGRRIVEHQVQSGDATRTYKVTLSAISDSPDSESNKTGGRDGAGVVAVLHDVTHEREVSHLKNEFVSHVSHELRTPLASIKAYVELLIDGEAHDEKTKREFYDIIQTEANRLGRQIDNILNISKIESGLVQIDLRPQALTPIVRDAIEAVQPAAERRRITINETLTSVAHQTMADRDMLYQAIFNLLSNAVKYTPECGDVCIETFIDEARRKIAIRITDNGVGIPAKDLPYVFDKFFRSDSNSRMAQGTGLGLSLVKHIVETVHRGRIFVESQMGKGSSFGFEVDLCD